MQIIALKAGVDFQWQAREEIDEMQDDDLKIFSAAQSKMSEGKIY